MPKPPILVAPSPNDTIASATWGDPVTDAINGLTTGNSIVGVIASNQATSQSLPTSTGNLTFPTPIYDSDGYFNPAENTKFVVPPGLNGLYDIVMMIGTDTAEAGKGMRLALYKNGVRLLQDQATMYSASAAHLEIGAILALNDGDVISGTMAGNHTGAITIVVKVITMRRIGDLPALE